MASARDSDQERDTPPYVRQVRTPLGPARGERRRDPRPARLAPRWGIWGGLLSLLLVVFLAKVAEPYRRAHEQHLRVRLLKSQVAALSAEQKRLRAESRALAAEWGQLGEARRQGYIFPGERRIIFLDSGKSAAPTQQATASRNTAGR